MIIYGWGHRYNKHDWTNHWGQCASCGRVGYLQNYSCTKFLSVYFMPIVPHGNERVIDLCPRCDRGKIMPLGKWKKLRKTELQPALAAFAAAPADPALAGKALDLAGELGDEKDLLRVAEKLAEKHSGNAELMARLGDGLSYFGRLDEAKAALGRSLQKEDDEDVRTRLDFLQEQTVTAPPRAPGLITRFGRLMVLPAIALLVFLGIAAVALSSKPKHVFVVNGLDVPYSVLVNDHKVRIPARGRTRVPVDFGSLLVKPVAGTKVKVDPVAVQLKAGFFSRASDRLVFLINPDRTALLSRDEVLYGDHSGPGGGSSALLVGQQFYSFEDIDYAFTVPPHSISTSSRSERRTRIVLDQPREGSNEERAKYVLEHRGKEAAANYCYQLARLCPESNGLLRLASSFVGKDRLLELSKRMLGRRPVLVGWHREYQELMKANEPNFDLVGQYRSLLKADPTNNSLRYLLARLIEDQAESRALFQKATEGEKPEPYAFFAIAYGFAADCKFEQALASIRKATALAPKEGLFGYLEYQMLLANQRWSELEKRARRGLRDAPHDMSVEIELLKSLCAADKEDEAIQSQKTYLAGLKMFNQTHPPAARVHEIKAELTATRAQWSEDPHKLRQAVVLIRAPSWRLAGALAKGNVAGAAKLIQAEPTLKNDPFHRLGLYALAAAAGKPRLAKEQLAAALQRLKSSGKLAARMAQWFAEGAAPPSLAQTTELTILLAQRKLVLLALATRYPAARKDFLRRTTQLNYDHDAWYFPIERIVHATK